MWKQFSFWSSFIVSALKSQILTFLSGTAVRLLCLGKIDCICCGPLPESVSPSMRYCNKPAIYNVNDTFAHDVSRSGKAVFLFHLFRGSECSCNEYTWKEELISYFLSRVSPFSGSYKSIVEFIDAQFEAYLQEELKIKRTLHSYHDTRIHACLYFIAPTGHSLKSLDLVTMKKLDSKVSFTWIHQTFVRSYTPFFFRSS